MDVVVVVLVPGVLQLGDDMWIVLRRVFCSGLDTRRRIR